MFLNSVKQNESKPIEIQLYDIAKCFDAQWPTDTMNDFYEASDKDDKLKIMSDANKNVQISIKTPFGKSERKTLKENEMQGSTFGPIKCAVHIDNVGKEYLKQGNSIYTYKNMVDIPPLSFIDDIIGISECGQKAIEMNSFINSYTQVIFQNRT